MKIMHMVRGLRIIGLFYKHQLKNRLLQKATMFREKGRYTPFHMGIFLQQPIEYIKSLEKMQV